MTVTPESALGWWDVVQTVGVTGVLLVIVGYGAWLIPRFMQRWCEHTQALTQIAERLENNNDRLEAIERELGFKNQGGK